MSTAERQPAYEITEAESRLVCELFEAGRADLARELADYLLDKRWPDTHPVHRVIPPNLVHLSDYRNTGQRSNP
jgi:hypothetical protein